MASSQLSSTRTGFGPGRVVHNWQLTCRGEAPCGYYGIGFYGLWVLGIGYWVLLGAAGCCEKSLRNAHERPAGRS